MNSTGPVPGASLVCGRHIRTGYCSAEEGSGDKVRQYFTLASITYRSLMPGAPGVIPGTAGCCDGD